MPMPRLSRRASGPIYGLLLGFSLLGGLAAQPAHAWNATGHMTVAQIAWRNLTPAAKANVTEMLTHSVSYASWVRQMPASYPDRDLYVFMRAATWPDDIRKSPLDRPAWHYVDLPIVLKTPSYNPDSATLAPVVPNAETELPNQIYVLGLATAAPADRANALCWVEHLTGDLSQPLHTTTLFSSTFPTGDKGGNSIVLSAPPHFPAVAGVVAFSPSSYERGSSSASYSNTPVDPANLSPVETTARPPSNLHALWDDMLGGTRDPADIDKIAAFLQTTPFLRAAFPQIVSHPTVPSWVEEGNALAVKYVYLNGTLPLSPDPDSPSSGPKAKEVAALPDGYLAAGQALSEQQIAVAGLRLADELNAVMGH